MSIPDFQSFMLPLLETIVDGREFSNREAADLLARRFGLTEEELEVMLPSGQQVFTNRLAWAKSYLKKAGLLSSPSRGMIQITEEGREALSEKPEKINIAFLKRFASYTWHKKPPGNGGGVTATQTPEEIIEESYQALRAELADDLLSRIKDCSPRFFERLVVRLLVAMGYGGSLADAGQAIGKSGDGGIDGIIKEDKLGLDIVCLQARRWANTVGRPFVQAFAGSMEGFRARKGVMITTSSFSREARDYVERTERKIILIEGERLAELMIDHDIGVTNTNTYALKKADLDFFVEEDA